MAQESLTLNISVSLMGSSSKVFMRWGGFILKVFMYLLNKKSRTVFGESVKCVSTGYFSVSLSSCLTLVEVVYTKGTC